MIDSHCHMSHPDFDADRDEVLARCWENGVSGILEVGFSVENSRKALALARKHPGRVRATAGIHPHEAGKTTEEDWSAILELIKEPEVVAVGEAGLDFYRDWAPKDLQLDLFRRSVRLAVEVDLPLIIHDRDAHDEILAILREEGEGKVRGVFHCFSGDLRVAEEAMALGFYLGMGGSITYWSLKKKGRMLKVLPLDRILLETDAPWLTPKADKGERNDPTRMIHVASRISEAQSVEVDEVICATGANTARLFTKGGDWPPLRD